MAVGIRVGCRERRVFAAYIAQHCPASQRAIEAVKWRRDARSRAAMLDWRAERVSFETR